MAWPSSSSRSKTWSTEILTASDLQGQLDLLHTYLNDSLNASTGHAHTGGTSDGPKITLTTGVQGTLPLANGGTGQTTLAGLCNLFYPVGSIYINYSDSTNPGTLLGFGTWIAIQDLMLIGVGTTFNTAGVTGGATTKNLAHTHTLAGSGTFIDSSGSFTSFAYDSSGAIVVPGSGAGTTRTKLTTTTNSGGSATQDIMPPYVVVYIWRRSV